MHACNARGVWLGFRTGISPQLAFQPRAAEVNGRIGRGGENRVTVSAVLSTGRADVDMARNRRGWRGAVRTLCRYLGIVAARFAD